MRRAWNELRTHPGRLLSVGLAITVSVAFVVACFVFVATETSAVGKRLTAESATSDVVVRQAEPGPVDAGRLAALPGVAAVDSTTETYAAFTSPAGPGLVRLQSLPERPEFRWSALASGRWPSTAGEVAVSAVTARSYALTVGSTLTLDPQQDRAARPLQVTGIVDQSRLLFADVTDTATVAPAFFTGADADLVTPTLLVRTAAGTDSAVVAAAVRAVVPPDTTVQTAAEVSAEALQQTTGVGDVFGYLVLVFGSIALLVGSMIILNTLVIILVQRRREIGLLRAVGASTAQVRRRLLAESLLIGLVGSALGVVVGVAVAAAGSAVSGALAEGLELPWGRLAASYAGGVVVTVLASLLPVHRASRVSPLEALRPVADAATRRRSTWLRTGLGLGAVLLGAAVVAVGLVTGRQAVLLAVAGSALTAVGILVLGAVFVPALLRLVGGATRTGGATARLAAANLVRNPGRSAATCTALMLAVGLIVTLQVGAASLKSTMAATLDEQFPVDLMVTNPAGPLSDAVLAAVAAVPGISATTPVREVTATVTSGSGSADGDQLTVAAPGPDAGAVVQAGLERLDAESALAHPNTLERLGRRSGDRVELSFQGREQEVVLVASDVADAGMLVVTGPQLEALAPRAPTAAVWAAVADRDQAAEVTAGIRKAMAAQPGLELGGSLPQAAEIGRLLDTLLRIATGLLAVAVLIALIGVGNTLGLSVLERTRESALLRALGLQRRQLRVMLAVEAAQLALVGAMVGVLAGIGFGSVGAAALARETEMGAVHLAVSLPQTLAVVLVSCLAGVLASVLPARRAARTTPTAALAEV